MSVIIGSQTFITGVFGTTTNCVLSANWNFNPNNQRFYCLGRTDPQLFIKKPTYNLSITLYSSGSTPNYTTTVDTDCSNSGMVSAGVIPASCDGSVSSFSYDDWVVSSYGYNKDDPQLPSQESWSLQRWADEGTDVVGPTYVIRGVTEGSVNVEVEPDAGIEIPSPDDTVGYQGSVSGGAIGRADSLVTGIVTSVGKSTYTSGRVGTGSVTIPYTPMWV